MGQGAHLVDPAVPATTKPGSRPPGICLLSRGFSQGIGPRGVGRSCARFLLGNSRDRFLIRVYLVVGGDAGAGTWGQVSIGTFRWVRGTSGDAMDGDKAVEINQRHARNIRDPSRVLEQGPDRQRAPDVCCGGLSSIRGASESRCYHDGPAGSGKQANTPGRHRS